MALELDAATHTYRLDGNVIPGVTETIKPLAPDFDRFPANEARRRGLMVHALTAVMDGRSDLWPEGLGDEEEDGALQGYCDAWHKFKVDTGAVIDPEFVEHPIHTYLYGYAGTVDRVVQLSGMTTVLDIKTGAYHPSHVLQLAAYRELVNSDALVPTVRAGIAVYLRKNGTYTTRNFDESALRGAFTTFLALRSITEWNNEHGKFTPEPVDDWVPLPEDEEFQL